MAWICVVIINLLVFFLPQKTYAVVGQLKVGSTVSTISGELNITAPYATYSGQLQLVGSRDTSQLLIKKYASQTTNNNPFILVKDASNAELFRINSGADNTSFFAGYQAGLNNTGNHNTAIGYQALTTNTSGVRNDAFGYQALYSNTTGLGNTALGHGALYTNSTKDYITALGYQSMYSATGEQSTAVGPYTLLNNTGAYNVAVGITNLYENTSGVGNTSLGYNSLRNNTTGNYNLALGYSAGPGAGSTNLSHTAAIGYAAVPPSSNRAVFSSRYSWIGSLTTTAWSTTSDRRAKRNIVDNQLGLDFIKKLRPVKFQLNKEPDDSKGKIYDGFIAQEVQQTMTDLGVGFSGLDVPKNPDDMMTLSYSTFVVPLVNAVKEQQQQIDDLKQRVDKLEKVINEIKK